MSKYGVNSGPYFSVFGLNTEIYGVNRIQFEYRKIQTRNNSVYGHFLRSVNILTEYQFHLVSFGFIRKAKQFRRKAVSFGFVF